MKTVFDCVKFDYGSQETTYYKSLRVHLTTDINEAIYYD